MTEEDRPPRIGAPVPRHPPGTPLEHVLAGGDKGQGSAVGTPPPHNWGAGQQLGGKSGFIFVG